MTRKNDLEWSPVCLSQIFTFERGKENNMASLVEGETPLVSARKVNNGIKGFVANPSKIIKGRNVLSLNNDGDGGAGLAFYQCVDFALDSHVTALHSKTTLSAQTLLFIAACISKQHAIFGHGYSISLPRAKRILSMLPVDDSGNPDYQYMAEYVNTLQNKLLERYKSYLTEQLIELGKPVELMPLLKKKWANFSAFNEKGLFNINATNSSIDGIKIVDDGVYEIPYVTRSALNNGISKYVSPKNMLNGYDKGDNITVGLDTQTAFWQPHDFVTGQNIQVITGKQLNKYVALFLLPLLKKQMEAKFNWGGNGATLTRMKRLEIMLPIDESGDPDYEYMEQYAKNMMIQKYQQYLNFIDSKQG